MRVVHSALVCIGVAALVAIAGKTAVAHPPPEPHHSSHEGQKAHHETHPGAHHDANHERHHEEPKRNDHERHHDQHHDSHHDDHHAHHNHHPWWHSWHRPTEPELTNWFGGWGWTAPVYYGYGRGGNVTYQNDGVYVGGTRTGTASEYANTAQTLASAGPSNESSSNDADWLPLGTFALSQQGGDGKSPQVLQLSVNKGGVVSGVIFNTINSTTSQIHGSVDQATQRVAFGLGDNSGLVAETGIHNFTRDKINLLVHQGNKKPQHYSLVRFQSPQGGNRGDEKID
jgi:hypothetical protein